MSTQTTRTAPEGGVTERRAGEHAVRAGAQIWVLEEDEAFASVPNGPGAAAILAAGIGCFAVGLFATLGDAFPAVGHFFNFYNPTGPLSGVTSAAIVVWLVAWYWLSRRWKTATVAITKVNLAAFVLLALGVLLTFPPFMDFLQGK